MKLFFRHLLKMVLPVRRCYRCIAFAIIAIGVSGVSTRAAELTLEARIARLAKELDAQRAEHRIPGMAIAVVQDDAIILQKGFGYANLESRTRVTPQTLFGVGSTTKAFTSTLVAMAVAEGRMGFDDKVTQHLPWFIPNLNAHTGELTLRDMLSHRSGVARNDLLWNSGEVDSVTLLKESLDAEPLTPFRSAFNYNNVMYLAAGLASVNAFDADTWHALVRDRIFTPLNMRHTFTSFDTAMASPHIAKGYQWDQALNSFDVIMPKKAENVLPAGGIFSDVSDMAQWVRFNLKAGEWNGAKLIGETAFQELQTPQIKIGSGIEYAMGWMTRPWRGRKIVYHSGNILGFAAHVAMMPEAHIGFVLLTNVTASPLQDQSMAMVWEAVLGEDVTGTLQNVPENLPDYVGQYVGTDGPLKDVVFTVQMKDETLAVDVPGQTLYALNPPDAAGKWVFKLTDAVSVSFERFEGGKPTAMRLHQSGAAFAFVRKENVPPKAPSAANAENGASKRAAVPTVAALDAMRGARTQLQALTAARGYELTGKVSVLQAGLTGKAKLQIKGANKMRQVLDFAEYGQLTTVFNAAVGATDTVGIYSVLRGKYLRQAQSDHPAALLNFAEYFDAVEVLEHTTFHGRPAYILGLQREDLPDVTLTMDRETGDILRTQTVVMDRIGINFPFEATFSDYRDIGGLRLAFKVHQFDPFRGNVVTQYTEATSAAALPDEVFQPHQSVQ
ncbi:MAG: serine hydrolase domain-containing protein [Pseudomonadota bacterium]